MDENILDFKAYSGIVDEFLSQTINYLVASECARGLIVNFGKKSFDYKRVVL
jgi:GxxExxY protein